MKTWGEVRENIQSLTNAEKEELDLALKLVTEIINRIELGLTQKQLAEQQPCKNTDLHVLTNMVY